MSLKSCEKTEKNTYELTVEVSEEVFKKALDDTYNKQKKNIVIPGFRKGKAPRGYIEKYYGEGVFFEGALDKIYPDATSEAIENSKLDVVSQPFDIEVSKIGKDGAEYKFKVTVKPEIKLGEYKGLSAEKESTKISDDELEHRLTHMREDNAVLEEKKKKAAKGDVVNIDFEGFVDGEAFDGGKAENQEITIGEGKFIPGFEDGVIGHKAGEEFEIKVVFPEDYAGKLGGKEAVFKSKLNAVKVKVLPELDDEFAKDVSEFDTLKEMKDALKDEMEHAKKHQSEDKFQNDILTQVVDGCEVEIPDVMIENEIDRQVEEFNYNLSQQGMNLKTYLGYLGMDEKGYRNTLKPSAEKHVKLSLALEKIAETEKLSVSDEDVEKRYDEYASTYKMEKEQLKKIIDVEHLKKEIMPQKAIDFILKNSKESAAKSEIKKKTPAKKTEGKKESAAKKTESKKESVAKKTTKPAVKKTATKKTTEKKAEDKE
ncbi:MAG: trigger factor [Candidatus Fimenecus sp.]